MVSTGIMDKKMETTMVFLGLYWDTGKENGISLDLNFGSYHGICKGGPIVGNTRLLNGSWLQKEICAESDVEAQCDKMSWLRVSGVRRSERQ